MTCRMRVVAFGLMLAVFSPVFAQTPLPEPQRGHNSSETPLAPPESSRKSRPPETRDVSLHPLKFASNFFSDQKMIYYTFPTQVAKGKHWKPVLAVAGVTGALVAIDPWQAKAVRRNSKSFEPFNNFFSEN